MNPSLPSGTKLGRYEIRSKLGEGGMGEVYLAQDTRLDRKVALKILPADVAAHHDRMNRFVQEAKSASALNHPNIITIYEIEQIDSVNFIATEFIDGDTLRQRMRNGAMKLSEVLDVAPQTASALSAAHAAGIVHRDIKPENIMLRRDGIVKVLDFGLAKLTERLPPESVDTEAPTRVVVNTDPGVVMGTAIYMSPEQVRGLQLDARTDIFSLGIVLYEMVAGCLPFAGATSSEVLASILSDKEPQPLARYSREVPTELERIVSKALRKNSDERYQTIKDLLIDFRDLKRELELQAQLERRVQAESSWRATTGVTESAMAETAQAQTAQTSAEATTRTTSSAEYIVSQVKGHKRGALLALVALILAGSGLAYWLYKFIGPNKPPTPSQALKITRLTSTGKATHAAISPDGKYVVYTLDDAGQQSLWLSQVVISSNVQIVPPAEVNYLGITFSRDGDFIYYARDDKDNPSGALYQAPVLGGNTRKLLGNIASPITLSPDGKRLAFVRDSPGQRGSALMVAKADGTEEKTLAAHEFPNSFMTGGPAWSPDGKIIAVGYWNRTGGVYRNVIGVSVADGTEQPITSRRWDALANPRIAWLSDSSGVLLTGQEQFGSMPQIWSLAWPRDETRSLTNDLNGYTDLTLTADSGTLSAVRSDRLINLWIAPNGDAGHARQITSGAEREDGGQGLAWTPDDKIVYQSQAGGNQNIWIIAADGAGNKQLSANGPLNVDSAISRDGKYVVWSSRRTQNTNIWRMEIDGNNPKQLTSEIAARGPQVSLDGKWVVYWRADNSLWRVPIDGGTPVRATEKAATAPVMSPDGNLIACNYLDEASGQYKIAIIPFAGGPPTTIFDIPGGIRRPLQWTHDGHAIAFIRTTNGVSNIWAQPLEGGEPKQLTDFKDQRIFNFAWSRDGKQLALARGVVNSDVVLISGFR